MNLAKSNANASFTKQLNDWRSSKLGNPATSSRPETLDKRDIIPWPSIRTILVPLDGSKFAEHAIPYAVSLAERSGALLKLVHVHLAFEGMDEFRLLSVDAATLDSLKRGKESYLDDVTRRISAVSSAKVATRVVTGHEVPASLQEFDLFDSDVVIMATHARGSIGRFWFGGVVHKLLPQLELPVMLVRGDESAADFAPKTIRHILIPLDGSSGAEQVLEPAAALGDAFRAKHTLMQVARLEPKHLIRYGSLRTDWVPSKRRETRARRYLETVASKLRGRFVNIQTRVVSSDERISSVISLDAKQCDADLIAISSSTRGRFSRILRGSAQDWLIRNADVPLLVVPRLAA